jgi:membrane-associated phospholipid phosphatase
MRKRVAAFVVLAVCSLAFILRMRNPVPTWWDEPVLRFFYGLQAGPLTWTVIITSWLGSVLVLGPLSVVLARRVVRSSRRDAWMLPLAGLGSSFVHLFLKIGFPRARPAIYPAVIQAPGEGTFPSGHAVNVTTFMIVAMLIARRQVPEHARKITIFGSIAIVWVSASRLYLQVHWPSDVLSGIVIGATYALLLELALHGRRATEPVSIAPGS